MRTDLVRRIEPTRTQTALSRDARAENVRRAFTTEPARRFPFFKPVAPVQLDGERVIVVDDVLTTGATANGVALQLSRLGAGAVCVWSVARAVLD